MFCINCGKEISNGAKFCPECGAAQQGALSSPASNAGRGAGLGQSTVQKAPYNMMCIVGLVISGISLLLNFFGIVGIAGTIVSVIGLISCKQKNENGRALAIIGIVIGSLSIIYAVISLFSL